jgi:uncharacterized protein
MAASSAARPHPFVTVRRRAAAMTRAEQLFVGGAAAIALHVVDDSFIQPRHGTSAADHLAGGVVPVAAVAAAVFAYPRARAGVRGALALFFGALGLIVGIEALYDTFAAGATGDDYSGLVAVGAGVLLLGLGGATLWRSRRRGDRRWRRYTRRGLITFAALVFVAQVMFGLGIAYGTTHVQRQTVPTPQIGSHENVSFTTSDGLRLRGWYIPSRNGAAVIAFPGRSGPQKHARMLARHGYGVLLFDRRGEGASDGDGNLFGWGGDKDILAAVEYLQARNDVEPGRIGGIGFSVGGELMLQAAAETDGLAAVVSEGAGTRWLAEEIDEMHTIPGWRKWLDVPTYATKTAALTVFGNTAPPPKLTDLVPKIQQPLFLIWAPNGGNAETMNPVYYRLAPGEKQIWAIPDARHIQGITKHPVEYERRVVSFFDDALLGRR